MTDKIEKMEGIVNKVKVVKSDSVDEFERQYQIEINQIPLDNIRETVFHIGPIGFLYCFIQYYEDEPIYKQEKLRKKVVEGMGGT